MTPHAPPNPDDTTGRRGGETQPNIKQLTAGQKSKPVATVGISSSRRDLWMSIKERPSNAQAVLRVAAIMTGMNSALPTTFRMTAGMLVPGDIFSRLMNNECASGPVVMSPVSPSRALRQPSQRSHFSTRCSTRSPQAISMPIMAAVRGSEVIVAGSIAARDARDIRGSPRLRSTFSGRSCAVVLDLALTTPHTQIIESYQKPTYHLLCMGARGLAGHV